LLPVDDKSVTQNRDGIRGTGHEEKGLALRYSRRLPGRDLAARFELQAQLQPKSQPGLSVIGRRNQCGCGGKRNNLR
jgi:hypothetical protein